MDLFLAQVISILQILLLIGIGEFDLISLSLHTIYFIYCALGKKWHDRRKTITPAFHFKILERFVDTFDRLGNKVIEKLHELNSIDNGDGIEFFNIAGLYTLDVISGKFFLNLLLQFLCVHFFKIIFAFHHSKETAMGVSVDALSKPHSEYVNSVTA